MTARIGLFFLCCLQLSFQGSAQFTFMKNMGGEKFDRALFLTGTSDKGYLACGYSNSFSSSNDVYLVKTDGQGNVQWQKTYGGNKLDMGWSVLELKDKGYLLHGCTLSKDTTNQDIYLLRLDLSGNIIWEKTYGSKKDERTTNLLTLADGNYLLIGERIIQDTVDRDSYLLKLDTSGNIIWEKTFGGPRNERTYYGAETNQGDYLITGSILPYNNGKADILLLKISREGDLIWSQTYGEKEVHDISHSFSRNKDGKAFTITGYIGSAQPGFHDALFMQVDADGKLLVAKRHTTGEDMRMMHAEETDDKGFIVTGYSRREISKNINDAVLLRYDSAGNVKWLKTFGTPSVDDQGYWIVCNADGGYTLTGFTYSHGINGDLWLIRTNANGDIQ